MTQKYQICTRCIMDTTDPNIQFDEVGICNHCRSYDQWSDQDQMSDAERSDELNKIITRIRKHGKNKNYDSIIGLSGGVDSSYLVYLAKKFNLRPLIVHCDNGWNSETAVKNIENLVRKLDFDLYTYVIDWEEFRDLQRSFLKASVIDIEMLTDHAIVAVMLNTSKKNNVNYILTGSNRATEFILPKFWVFSKLDARNIKAIHKIFGVKKLKTFPFVSFFDWIKRQASLGKPKFIKILNYVEYDKQQAKEILEKELEWKDYGGKHHESIFTKFYQAAILPKKFKVDKRKAHLSSLIVSGQISRDKALNELARPLYDNKDYINERDYCIKKLGFTEQGFEEILKKPVRSHSDFPNATKYINLLKGLKKRWKENT